VFLEGVIRTENEKISYRYNLSIFRCIFLELATF